VISRAVAIAAVALLVLLYVRSPIDLIPDFAGVLGFVDDLVVIALAIWWLRKRAREVPGATRARPRPTAASSSSSNSEGGAAAWDPWRVLGIEPGASRDEIAHAYRAQLKLYHPDRVADLGEELRSLAHQKAIDLRRAYEELKS